MWRIALNWLQTCSSFHYFVISVCVLSSRPGYGAFVPFHKLLMAWEWQKHSHSCRAAHIDPQPTKCTAVVTATPDEKSLCIKLHTTTMLEKLHMSCVSCLVCYPQLKKYNFIKHSSVVWSLTCSQNMQNSCFISQRNVEFQAQVEAWLKSFKYDNQRY